MDYNKKAPTHPAYELMLKAMKEAPPNFLQMDPVVLREITGAPVLPPDIVLPETHVEEKEITVELQDADDQKTSTLKLTITRPPGTENKSIPAFIYL